MELVAKKRTDFKVDGLPKNPGFGTIGTQINVFTNHFRVTIPKTGTIYHYDIDIKDVTPRKPDPAAKPKGKGKEKAAGDAPPPGAVGAPAAAGRISKRLKRQIVEAWQDQHRAFFSDGTILGVYDGEKNFYTCKKLNDTPKEFEIVLLPNQEEGTREKNFIVLVKEVAVLLLETLHNAISDRSNAFPADILTALQCVMREALARWCPVAGQRTFFFPENRFPLNGEANGDFGWKDAWPGIFMSLRPNLWKLTLNLDISHTALSKRQPFLEFYANFIWYAADRLDVKDPRAHHRVADHDKRSVEREVYGCKVETSYSGGTRRWRCCGISSKPLCELDFALPNGRRQKVVDYFRAQYPGVNLEHTHLPAVQVGSQAAPKYLPMTLTTILAGQKMGRKLAEQEVAVMVRECAKPAFDRKRQITDIRTLPVTTIGGEAMMVFDQRDNLYLQQFGVVVDREMPLVKARVLPVPSVDGRSNYTVNAEKATVDTRLFLPQTGMPLTDWAVLNLSRDRRVDGQMMQTFLSELYRIGRQRMGTFDEPKNVTVTDFWSFKSSYTNLKKQVFGGRKPQLLMVIVPRKGCPEYAPCKQFFDVQEGVKTQMIAADSLVKNVQRGLKMYVGNLLLKINAKLNGSNQIVAMTTLPRNIQNLSGMKKLMSEPIIIFGADVTHPSPGMSSDTPSIAAVVASVDKYWAQYRARVCAQSHREEIIQNMEVMVKELLIEYRKCNRNVIPQRIIFFRDGVSEGQLPAVRFDEVKALKRACEACDPEYKPGVTYIIVGKRHHTRLFPEKRQNSAGTAGNVQPGTVVDQGICHYAELDYYLCSHFGIQGTSRPAHYHVLWDDNDLDVDTLQLMSYYLCYNYQRCTRAVSVPAPAYYAHHVAFRARHHLAEVFVDDGADTCSGLSAAQKQLRMDGYNQGIRLHADTRNFQYFC